jgi:hypothetical protein
MGEGRGTRAGAGFVATAVARYLLARQEAARGILRSELERAGVSVADFKDLDQLAAAAVRYHRAARDQAADANLRILGQAMIGLARRHELWASDFLKYADILAPLSRDELVLLGKIMEADRQQPPADMFMAEELDRVWYPVMRDSISIFGTAPNVYATAAQAARSGLIVPVIFTRAGISMPDYALSPLGREVRSIVDIPAALQTE